MSDFLKDREADLEGASTATEGGDVESFTPQGRRAILGLLITLGDNKYKLGRRYSEWATSAPTLEASVAAASMTSQPVWTGISISVTNRSICREASRSASMARRPFAAGMHSTSSCSRRMHSLSCSGTGLS